MQDENSSELTPQEQKKVDDLNWELQFRKDCIKSIQENESIQNYFKQYTDHSVKQFIDYYVNRKVHYFRHGLFFQQQFNEHDLQWVDKATEHLSYLQQKKLFDLQCLWRAGQIELPGVELTCDFLHWEENIFNCPFVDPISPDDVELYQQYLAGFNVDIDDPLLYSLSGWQQYDEIKAAYHSDSSRVNFPEWYDFYNGRKGTAVYMSLPNIKGEREAFYRKLGWSKEERQQRQKAGQDLQEALANPTKERKAADGRTVLQYFNNDVIDWFVETFEDKQSKEYYRAYRWYNRKEDEDDGVDEAMIFLQEADEYVPIESHYDWREAIRRAAHRYQIKKVSEAMQPAYEQYMLNISLGIKFPEKETPWPAVRETIRKEILKGRIANGEPEDLNY